MRGRLPVAFALCGALACGGSGTKGGAGGKVGGASGGAAGSSAAGDAGADAESGAPGAGGHGGVGEAGNGGSAGGDVGGSGGGGAGGRGGTSGGGGAAGGGASGGGGAGGNAATALAWDFTSGAEGWTGAFADYPMGMETFYELAFGQAALPAEVGPGGGLRFRGNNHSDDLFMFASHAVDGLRPAAAYDVEMEIVLATNAPADCGGIGGAPGTSVFVKAGAIGHPVSAAPNAAGVMVIDVDKGMQSQGGTEMKVLGDIGNTNACPAATYQLKTLRLTGVSATTSADGKLWLVVGTDSGFEGLTVLYYDRITAKVTPR